MSSDPRFVHLRVHTEHSLLEGAVRLKTLPGMCRDAGMPAVAVTDTNNMFAALEFSEVAAGAGIQPIMGCQIDVGYLAELPGERQPEPGAAGSAGAERGGLRKPPEAQLPPLHA